MPGAYAHITLVNILKEPRRLEAIAGFPADAITSVLDFFKYCELGAVSPDYPYLVVGDKAAAKWADLMHYTNTGSMIHAGIRRLRTLSGDPQRKVFAWLLGYSAHVGADVTIHPVVELKVGPYHGNETAHRICEMHQDAHIFRRLDLGQIGLSEHLDSGIAACSNHDKNGLDTDVAAVWSHMMQTVHAAEHARNRPDPNKWHASFKTVVDNFGEEGNKLMPLARHVAVNLGLTYPEEREIDRQYIENLEVPSGRMHYDAIFDKAISSVSWVWGHVAAGVFSGSESYATVVGNWNLDTGRDSNQNLVFWS